MSEASTAGSDAPQRGKSVKGDKALESLDFGSRTTGAQAAARSRLVRRLRIALPIIALVLVGVFLVNSQSNKVDQAFLEDFKTITASTEELRMANPRFAGVDDDGKPFEITADAALQDPGAKDVVELENPRAVQGDKDASSVVTASSGFYRTEENILLLKDSVTLEHELGSAIYVLRSPEATVSVKDQIVTSAAGVGADGPDGAKLTADRMKAYRADGRVVFEGNVAMRIYPNASKSPVPVLRDANEEKDEE